MDIATLFGIFSAFGLVILAIVLGGGITMFINVPSLMIVLGGTLGATMISYPIKEVFGAVSVVKNVFFEKMLPLGKITERLISMASKARKEGMLTLESEAKSIEDDFFRRGIEMSVDGLEPGAIQEILNTEVAFLKERHTLGADIFATMGSFSPALGMIGTLIGLVQMLQSMDDPSTIGPSMAVALLTTFYGSILANLVFIPVAGKLRIRSKEEALRKELIIHGIVSLCKGDNPRILEQKLMAFMAPKYRHRLPVKERRGS